MARQSYENIIRPARYVIFFARNQQKGCFRQLPLSRAGDSVWPISPSVTVSKVFSVSAVIPERAAPFRKMRQRRAEPPVRKGTQTSRSRKLYKDGSFTK